MNKCLICTKDVDNLSKHLQYVEHVKYKDYYDKYLKTENDGKCIICGKSTSWNRHNYRLTCSIQCSGKSQKRLEKIKNTTLERYGVTNAYCIDTVKQNSIKAIKEQTRNYKCLYCGKDCGIKKFCSNDCKLQYSKEGNSYNNREQAIETCREQFKGKMNSGAWSTRKSNIEKFEKEHNCTSVKKLNTLYGQAWKVLNLPRIMINKQNSAIDNNYLALIEKFVKKYNINSHSSIEDVIYTDISSIYFGSIYLNNRKIIHPYELDLYLPELNLAIEYNGTYWHSQEKGKSINYHLNKSILCREKNIRLIHIYEFEDFNKQIELIKSLILGKDLYPKEDFNKNNLIDNIPKPEIIYRSNRFTIYGAGKLF